MDYYSAIGKNAALTLWQHGWDWIMGHTVWTPPHWLHRLAVMHDCHVTLAFVSVSTLLYG